MMLHTKFKKKDEPATVRSVVERRTSEAAAAERQKGSAYSRERPSIQMVSHCADGDGEARVDARPVVSLAGRQTKIRLDKKEKKKAETRMPTSYCRISR